jgi:esterase/lipase superfamily enzyme
MQTEPAGWFSQSLGQPMEMKIYGFGGQPVLVFPTSGGRFFEYEDFGMVQALATFLEGGRLRLFTVDSVDRQSWLNPQASAAEKVARHEAYERYILGEVLPFITGRCPDGNRLIVTGCSLGAYHAANLFFRHPDPFDTVIGLSGVYGLNFSLGEDLRDGAYFHSPLHYLRGLEDPWYLDRYRKRRIVFCAGQGAWEDDAARETLALKNLLEAKGVPAWVDLWGTDVSHDWHWWQRQMPYFLERLGF